MTNVAAQSGMHGSSAGSLQSLTADLTAALSAGADGLTVSDSLFRAADVLRDQPALRRAATDPSTAAEAKSALMHGIFDAHLDPAGATLVAAAGSLRWGHSNDLATALEHLGVVALVRAADAAGEGDRLEDELFAFGRAVADHPELRDALADPGRSAADKQGLVRTILGGRASAGTLRLAERSVSSMTHTVARSLAEYAAIAAATRNRLVGLVRSATPLSAEEQRRLADVLGRQYGQSVHLNVVLDPALVGGARVELGDTVIDGTIASRLDDARRRLVG